MGSNSAMAKERPRSFGIGGAGNIRTWEEAVVHDAMSASEAVERRRSSLMSLGSVDSADSKSSKISGRFKSIFRSRSKSIPEVSE
ncbi:uncharacterized protein F4807DRAFT_433576 [Annulohypoxylon truncatum]|uniref:uncharacterized protein n=1 Tax=Annulohypoxylon truncatum TaxID=327061 RepID=UPI002007C2DF|nr:uncharacterized protein F4807DRAFT_433576 [Annulohypoxylon truncatum]KAI1207873.1 hypothetical protein F4807DRAFT_433576 [Annulohypoxylon truncatum]